MDKYSFHLLTCTMYMLDFVTSQDADVTFTLTRQISIFLMICVFLLSLVLPLDSLIANQGAAKKHRLRFFGNISTTTTTTTV